jgi:hypothetical protein
MEIAIHSFVFKESHIRFASSQFALQAALPDNEAGVLSNRTHFITFGITGINTVVGPINFFSGIITFVFGMITFFSGKITLLFSKSKMLSGKSKMLFSESKMLRSKSQMLFSKSQMLSGKSERKIAIFNQLSDQYSKKEPK